MDIFVKIDSDGKMDPALIGNFIEPIILGQADYTREYSYLYTSRRWLQVPFLQY